MPNYKKHCFLSLLAILVALFLAADTCFHSIYKKQAEVLVFEDADGDGRMDRGEAPLPGTLVLGDFNIHGSGQRTAALTGEDGKAILAVEYTHYFNVIVIPPCGATATTPTTLDATEEKRLRFGFAPQDPRPGPAEVRFHLWEDRDASGAQETGEGPLANLPLFADPLPETAPHSGIYFGLLALQSDAEGNATLELGNSCGNVLTPFRHGWNFTSFSPEPSSTEGGLWFPYREGVTEVTLGLYPLPTPTPYPTWTNEP